MIGADDPIVDNAQRKAFEEEMHAGGVDWQLVVYGGAVHSFTNPGAEPSTCPGIEYHEPTDRRSWQAMGDLFDEVVRVSGAPFLTPRQVRATLDAHARAPAR